MLRRLAVAAAAACLVSRQPLAETAPGAGAATVPAGVPLRVQLDHGYPVKAGTRVQGHLITPVYLVDRAVLPADTHIYGTITGSHPLHGSCRVNALLDGDFTPLVVPEITFDSIETPSGAKLPIATHAIERTASIVKLTTSARAKSVKDRVEDEVKQRKQDAVDRVARPGKADRVRQYFYAMLPYHPQRVWSGTQFDADLTEPLTIPSAPAPANLPPETTSRRPVGIIEARLMEDLDSRTTKVGTPVEAVLSRPLFDASHEHIILPEGTKISGSVVQVEPAASFGRHGRLRFTFKKIEMAGASQPVHGQLTGAESQQGQNLDIDSEGGVRTTSPYRVLGTLALGAMAAASQLGDGDNLAKTAVVSNGFRLVGRVASLASGNRDVASGFAYYALAKDVYRQWIARGKDVSFPRDTRIQIELAER